MPKVLFRDSAGTMCYGDSAGSTRIAPGEMTKGGSPNRHLIERNGTLFALVQQYTSEHLWSIWSSGDSGASWARQVHRTSANDNFPTFDMDSDGTYYTARYGIGGDGNYLAVLEWHIPSAEFHNLRPKSYVSVVQDGFLWWLHVFSSTVADDRRQITDGRRRMTSLGSTARERSVHSKWWHPVIITLHHPASPPLLPTRL